MDRRDAIAIGGSVGAVDAVKHLLSSLPQDVDAAIFIVIHVGALGNNMLADIFDNGAAFPVTTAVDGEPVRKGRAYVAAADHHLLIMDDTIRLGRGPRENLSRPAIDPLFRSVGASFGSRAMGIALTGMLNDGAAGLADLKRCGGITVVQNPADAVAPEMPMGSLRASNLDYRAPLVDLPQLLLTLASEKAGPPVIVPEDIRIEIEIALGLDTGPETISAIADPVPISCPACGGVLSQIRNGHPLRFRCQVGHAYTADVLCADSEGTVDEALRVALRIIEERVTLSEKMADDAQRSGFDAAAAANKRRADEGRHHIATLRSAILGKG